MNGNTAKNLPSSDQIRPAEGQSLSRVWSWQDREELLSDIVLLLQRPAHVSWFYWRLRRLLDIALALALIAIGMPFLLLVALVIKLDSPGPVFFRQVRIGQGLQTFRIIKFRTMYRNVSPDPVAVRDPGSDTYRRPRFTEDPRVTRVGRWLRSYSFDELPQVANVLTGAMSFIGPRPLTMAESLAAPRLALVRYAVPAGITGLAQIRDRYSIFTEDRFDADIEYVRTLSPAVDWAIFRRTFTRLRDRG